MIMKLLVKIFYNILKGLNLIINFFLKRDLLLYLKLLIEKDSYVKKNILGESITFFVPNELIKWRLDTFFTKEPETLSWIDNFEKKNKIIFWDIGANIGLYSIYASLKHSDIQVTSFEPSTSNLRTLSRNISINNLDKKITISQLPLSNLSFETKTLNETNFLEGYSQNTFGSEINFDGKKMKINNKYKILGTSVDYLTSNNILNFPNYIKIDVDGIEHLIMKGSIKTFTNEKLKSILVEINENYSEQYTEILKIMEKSGFRCINKNRAEEFYKGKFNKTFNYIFKR